MKGKPLKTIVAIIAAIVLVLFIHQGMWFQFYAERNPTHNGTAVEQKALDHFGKIWRWP